MVAVPHRLAEISACIVNAPQLPSSADAAPLSPVERARLDAMPRVQQACVVALNGIECVAGSGLSGQSPQSDPMGFAAARDQSTRRKRVSRTTSQSRRVDTLESGHGSDDGHGRRQWQGWFSAIPPLPHAGFALLIRPPSPTMYTTHSHD